MCFLNPRTELSCTTKYLMLSANLISVLSILNEGLRYPRFVVSITTPALLLDKVRPYLFIHAATICSVSFIAISRSQVVFLVIITATSSAKQTILTPSG